MKRSRMGRRRAFVLILVHVAMAVHIVQWALSGKTISPVEPSEAMQTLETGRVNAGFLFFAAAIVATLVLGRFICGWACHLVALQDLCGWMLKKAGVRPRPFRSRLLIWVPVAFAFYMFFWPTLERTVVHPLLLATWPAAAAWLGPQTVFPGFTDHLVEEDFWQTFPGVAVAIPFLLICGFATVYFLGSKGFCTYGCPYGGIFRPVDRLSPARILADLSLCEKCGHCTINCTSNVRVHEEIQLYSAVVDPGCMKCMDCVSVCPNDALSYGFGTSSLFRRATGKRPGRTYDLTLPGEVAVAATFLLSFLAWRGSYRLVPMLMAIGLALCVTYALHRAWLLLREKRVEVHLFTLKDGGRWRPLGTTFFGLSVVTLLLTLHTGWVRLHLALGDHHDGRVAVSRAAAFGSAPGSLPEEYRQAADRALAHYRKARSIARGGLGLVDTPDLGVRMAWLELVAGRPDRAAAALEEVLREQGPDDDLIADQSRLLRLSGRPDEAKAVLEMALRADPDLLQVRHELAASLTATGQSARAIALLEEAVERHPEDTVSRGRLAALLLTAGFLDEAVLQLRTALENSGDRPELLHDLATALFLRGDRGEALRTMERARELAPGDPVIAEHLETMRRQGIGVDRGEADG
jgi:polyferredoxin/tetratricopeptide (TPR) repeat protein